MKSSSQWPQCSQPRLIYTWKEPSEGLSPFHIHNQAGPINKTFLKTGAFKKVCVCAQMYTREREWMCALENACVFACICEEWVRRMCIHTPVRMQTSLLRKASTWMRECAQVVGALAGAREGMSKAGFQLARFQGTFPKSAESLWSYTRKKKRADLVPVVHVRVCLWCTFPLQSSKVLAEQNTSVLHWVRYNVGSNRESGLMACAPMTLTEGEIFKRLHLLSCPGDRE